MRQDTDDHRTGSNLLRTHTDASRILVMTFTNRAARTLRQRLRDEVGHGCDPIEAGTFHAFCLRS
jgi:DNA helicase-2/ATP-dependent DNA helicase PcrA